MNQPIASPIDLADLERSAERNIAQWIRTARRVGLGGVAASVGLRAIHLGRRAKARRRASQRAAWMAAGMGVASAAFLRWQFQRLFAPGADYVVEARHEEFEVRRYAPTRIAHTTVSEPWERALNEGFRRLADFIFGRNSTRSTIAMTSPVTVSQDEAGYRVSFVMPEDQLLPKPDDSRVVFAALPGRRVAALRFNGRYDGVSVEAKKRALVEGVAKAGYVTRGEPVFAGYDPPSTLPVLRRNEVWLEID